MTQNQPTNPPKGRKISENIIALISLLAVGIAIGTFLQKDKPDKDTGYETQLLREIDSLQAGIRYWKEQDSIAEINVFKLKNELNDATKRLQKHRSNVPRGDTFRHVDPDGLDSLWSGVDSTN